MTARVNMTRFRVEGVDCASCAARLDTAIRRLDGVADVSMSVVSGTMTVCHDRQVDLDAVERTVTSLGHRLVRLSTAPTHDHEVEKGAWWQSAKVHLIRLSVAATSIALAIGWLVPAAEKWAFILAMMVGLVPIARRAFMGVINGSPFSIETLMSIAAVGAVFIGAAEEASIVVLLFLVGEWLEGAASRRARVSIKALANLVPRMAQRDVDGIVSEVPADRLQIDDVVLVRPGDRIPADGTVLSGESAVDEAPVTGESVPRRKSADDVVYAGTINQDGALRVRVTAAAADNTIARIVALVEEAQEAKAPTERFIDGFSRYYTPGVMIVAASVALLPPLFTGSDWDEWIYKGLAVLLIGCPCALVISTPAAIASALSAGARRGLLMKGGVVLEMLGRLNMVVLDKTGTLTEGRPQITDIIGVDRPEVEVLTLSTALAAGSGHPLALAILAYARSRGILPRQVENARVLGGKGVAGMLDGKALFLGSPRSVAEIVSFDSALSRSIATLNDAGKTVSVLLVEKDIAGLVAMRDEPRADAHMGLAALRQLGVDIVMLTGDNSRTAAAIATALDIPAHADLLPADKQRIIDELKTLGKRVAKVGDGINDAPALAAADIGIAMGGGSDIALDAADAAVLHGRVSDIANMIVLSRATMANIGQNITIALGLKAMFFVTALSGFTGLWPAILADTGATVLVTANAMRLLGWKGPYGR